MDFSAFDQTKTEEHAKQAKDKWQYVQAYQEFAERRARGGAPAKRKTMLAQGADEFL